ncbi:MAG: metallophosphoesterase [Candidatus Eisenbacteria bacterium]|nr:metallophosphoesterase [Candidatus Eisenbacteria bacterium]
MVRRWMALPTALALCAAWAVVARAADGEPLFHMAILSDRTGGHVPGIYERVIDEINLLDPDIVVTVGDHIEGYGEDYDRARAEWDSLLPVIRGLRAPVHMTPGNHDIWSDDAEVVYVEKTGQQPYYSFDYRGVHFIILDTARLNASAEVVGPQREWLEADLMASAGAARTFVFFHKPFWERTLPAGEPDPLHDLFVRYGVDAVFNGHYHTTITDRFDGIDYVVVGSSGGGMGRDDSVVRGQFYQFGWVSVRPDGHQIAIVGLGSIHPFGVVSLATRDEIARIERDQVTVAAVPVFENASVRAPLVVSIRNDSGEPVDDLLTWTATDGWTVEPTEARVSVAPGGAAECRFTATNTGDLYPLPRLSLKYPLSDGRRLDVDVPLRAVRTATAARFERSPVIDGAIDEEGWGRAAAVSRLFPPYEETVEGETRVLFGYDDANLYIAADCAEPIMDALAARVTERDGAVYGEDCVGFFIQPNRDHGTVYQIYWNPVATAFDQRIVVGGVGGYSADRAWDGEHEAAVARLGDRWVLEARISMDTLETSAAPGAVWGLNFRRKQARTGASADWQVPIDYDPSTFGRLVLE